MKLSPLQFSDKFTATATGSSVTVVLIMLLGRFGVALTQTESAALVTVIAAGACYLREEQAYRRFGGGNQEKQ